MNRHKRHGNTRFLWSFVGSCLFLTLTLSIFFFVPVKAEASLLDALPVNIPADTSADALTNALTNAPTSTPTSVPTSAPTSVPKSASQDVPADVITDTLNGQTPLVKVTLPAISSDKSDPQEKAIEEETPSSTPAKSSLSVPALRINLPVISIQTPEISIPDKLLPSVNLPKVEVITPIEKIDPVKIDTPIAKVEVPIVTEPLVSRKPKEPLLNTDSPVVSLKTPMKTPMKASVSSEVKAGSKPEPTVSVSPPDMPLQTFEQQEKQPQVKSESFVVKKEQPLQPEPISKPFSKANIPVLTLSPSNPIPQQQGGIGHSGGTAGPSLTAVWCYESIYPIWQQMRFVEHRLIGTDQWSHAPPGQPPMHSFFSRTDFETPKFEK